MKKIANCIHHTHWDLIWYFTVQDADVQFAYNFKEILNAFDKEELENFYLDGQTAPIDSYLRLFPEERERISKYVSSGQLIIGPFNSQLDSFITSGESVINNLRLGFKTSSRLGNTSNIAYLPDSFGHSIDYPKIFNQFGINDFVITRGVGDEYGLGSEFYLKSNDGSEVLVYTMIAGYGYGCYGFKEGTLFTGEAVDYNKIDVRQLIDRLLSYSTIDDQFVFPLGFDQNPMIHGITDKIKYYNTIQKDIEFVETTWKDFFDKIRNEGKDIKTHQHELISTQYHRVHRSIYSARADVKGLQDKCERILTYELQPMMSLLDSLGIEYSHGLLDKAWETLILCQTHSSANLTDETNDYIERETKNALNLAQSHKLYLLKLMSISLNLEGTEGTPLIVMNTLPHMRSEIVKTKVFSKSEHFNLYYNGEKISYTILNKTQKNNGVLRKEPLLINEDNYYYETDILLQAADMKGLSYRTYFVKEEKESSFSLFLESNHSIENEYYQIYQNEKGVGILDKKTNAVYERAIVLEDAGDEGDSFDYSYPPHDWKILDYLENADVRYSTSPLQQKMDIKGQMQIPYDLKKRKQKRADKVLNYKIQLILEKDSPVIKVSGSFTNESEQHRVRLIFTGNKSNTCSFAGTQYSVIKRKTVSEELNVWKEKNYFEEPSPIYPLLNHVSAVNKNRVMTVYTRSSKEYEFVGEEFKDIGVTIFRAYGALGYPDLNRRPGRPSGLDYRVFKTPSCQMKGENQFELGLSYMKEFDENTVFKRYVDFATDSSVYHKQTYDKSINPIDYFPTNPLKEKLPLNYDFMEIEEGEGVFGSIVKSGKSDAYLLRIFNASLNEVNIGSIKGVISEDNLYATDLRESFEEKVKGLNVFKPGELKIIKMKKGEF
ncbi:hypothetical protein AB4027_04770 [Alkalibacterium putridalgicola]|uniref:glycoside hydrolase family 38 N-terminal domain-containing protein n=1 Tax=Alkalibacterium putridalgicola TaxID=426703 RepID=UPI0034CFFDC0